MIKSQHLEPSEKYWTEETISFMWHHALCTYSSTGSNFDVSICKYQQFL